MLDINWILPCCEKDYLSKPLDYFKFLLAHRGSNSLLSYLKAEGLALSASCNYESYLGLFTVFNLQITLTKKGFEHYFAVLQVLFKYINVIKDTGPRRSVFEECKIIGQAQFDYLDKEVPGNYVY